MSEVKKAAEKTEKAVKKAGEGKLSKIIAWFRNLPQKIAKPFRNMYYELKKVTWPSKHKLITYSVIVLLFMLFMGVVIGLLDMGASAAVRSLIPGNTSTATAATTAETAEEVSRELLARLDDLRSNRPDLKRRILFLRQDDAPLKRLRGLCRAQVLVKLLEHPDSREIISYMQELAEQSWPCEVLLEINPASLA